MNDPPAPAPAPDPVATAAAQAKSNKETATTQYGLNATNQKTPTGSLSYNQIGTWPDGTPRFEATTELTPDMARLRQTGITGQQALADIGVDQTQRVAQTLNKPADFGPNLDLGPKLDLGQSLNLGAGPDLGGPLKLDTDATEARTMELARKRLDPMLAEREEAVRSRLFNAGVQPGTEAYRREMEGVSQGANDARNQLLLGGHDQAVRDLMAEFEAGQGQRKYGYEAGQAKTAAEYAADQAQRQTEYGADQTQRQVGYNANLQKTKMTRDQMFNEIASLLSGSQIQMPQFTNTPQPGVAPTDVIGAQQQALNQSNVGFNAANARNNAMIGGLFGLGKTALSAGMGGWGV